MLPSIRKRGAPFKPRALYYQVFSRRILRLMVRLMPLFGKDPTKFGANEDVNLKELAEVDFPVHVRVDITPVAEIKQEAGRTTCLTGWRANAPRLDGRNDQALPRARRVHACLSAR